MRIRELRIQTATRRILLDFGWARQPYQWLLLAGLLVLSIGLGVWAYQQPLTYTLNVGGVDGPFVHDVSSRNIGAAGTSRWLRGESGISLPGISASHPLTLSVHLSGEARADVQAKQAVSFTISINGHQYPAQRLPAIYSWFRWHIDKGLIQNGRLDVRFSVPPQTGGIIIWPAGMLLDKVTIEPDGNNRQQLADYAELDWRNVIYLAAIVLLVYSFFARTRRRWLMLAGLLISAGLAVALAELLRNNRPLFVVYASSVVLALLLARLALPLVSGDEGKRHPARWLFLLALATALLFLPPDFQSRDDALKYLTTESMLMRGTLMLPPPQLDEHSAYARYGLGHSVASLPLLAVGLAVQPLNGAPDSIRYFFVLLLDPIISALGVVLLFLCARRMFGSERLAIALSLIYFFATFAFVYAAQSWSEPLVATLMLLAFYAMLRVFAPLESQRHIWLMVAGFALGYMLFTREEYALAAAIFGLWWLARRGVELRQEGGNWQRTILTLVGEGLRLLVPVLAFLMLNLSYNFVRSGSLFGGGYANLGITFDNPWLAGVYGLLLSSGKGLLWFAPPVIFCAWAISKLWRSYRWEGGLIGLLFGLGLLFYAIYPLWNGGVCWGPRFLVPYLPLLMLASGAVLASWGEWRHWQRGGYIVLVLAGGWLALVGALTQPLESWLYGRSNQSDSVWNALTSFSPTRSQIVSGWDLVQQGYTQSQAVFQLSWYHFPAISDHLVPGLLLALAVVAALQLSVTLRGNGAEAGAGEAVIIAEN